MTDYARLESHQRDPDCETTPRWILTNNKLLENVQNRTHTTHKARATGMTVLEREKTKRRKKQNLKYIFFFIFFLLLVREVFILFVNEWTMNSTF